MADTKISALTAVTTPASTDEFAVNQGGTSKKMTRAQVHTLESGEHLVLPQDDDGATPTLAFGDGDSGFWEKSDDRIDMSLSGAAVLNMLLSGGALWMKTPAGNSAALTGQTPSATVPGFSFWADGDTGIGRSGADQLSLIAGGVEQVRLDVTGNHVINALLDAATGNEAALTLSYTTNKATSGDDIGIILEYTDTASPGTSSYMSFRRDGTEDLRIGGFSDTQGGVYFPDANKWMYDHSSGPVIQSGIGFVAFWSTLEISNIDIRSASGNRFHIENSTDTSTTNPAFVPDRSSTGTGVGGDAATHILSLISNSAEAARVDNDSTAGNTRFMVYDVDNATLERVTVGAADSGGSGFKVLRIPN